MLFASSIGDINYRKVGHGPHLSFLHGFCESAKMWDGIVAELSKHYSCLLIDLPGFGQSPLKGTISIEEMATAVTELVAHDTVGTSQGSVLLGHSMGGYVAIEALSQSPEYFRGIGMIHSTVYADNEEKRSSRQKVVDFVQTQPAEAFLKQFYTQLVADQNFKANKERLWDLVKDTSRDAIINASKAMMSRTDHLKTIEKTAVPILFLTGDSDKFFTTESIYKQASHCEMTQICVLKGVGHLSVYEDETGCLQAINDYLDWALM